MLLLFFSFLSPVMSKFFNFGDTAHMRQLGESDGAMSKAMNLALGLLWIQSSVSGIFFLPFRKFKVHFLTRFFFMNTSRMTNIFQQKSLCKMSLI